MSNPRTIDYAKRNEALLLHHDVTATAYQRGFEDMRYGCVHGCIYRNPFAVGSYDWLDYDRGFADAVRTAQEERV